MKTNQQTTRRGEKEQFMLKGTYKNKIPRYFVKENFLTQTKYDIWLICHLQDKIRMNRVQKEITTIDTIDYRFKTTTIKQELGGKGKQQTSKEK